MTIESNFFETHCINEDLGLMGDSGISRYFDEVLEQDDAFSDVRRIAGPDQAPGILKLRSRTHLK